MATKIPIQQPINWFLTGKFYQYPLIFSGFLLFRDKILDALRDPP